MRQPEPWDGMKMRGTNEQRRLGRRCRNAHGERKLPHADVRWKVAGYPCRQAAWGPSPHTEYARAFAALPCPPFWGKGMRWFFTAGSRTLLQKPRFSSIRSFVLGFFSLRFQLPDPALRSHAEYFSLPGHATAKRAKHNAIPMTSTTSRGAISMNFFVAVDDCLRRDFACKFNKDVYPHEQSERWSI
jgi:hypothetical protein